MREQEACDLQCACGYAILCEVRRLGERVGTFAFFDQEPTSKNLRRESQELSGLWCAS